MAGKSREQTEAKPGSTLKDKLARLGIAREQDLVLHLPLRYEDQTRLCPLAAVRSGQAWQVEGTVANTEIQYRGRRQLVCLLAAGAARPLLGFCHFSPTQHKPRPPGKRALAFGEVRECHLGPEMIHPSFHVVAPGPPRPERLTPVYPTTAGLSQDTLRKLVHNARVRNPAFLAETLPPWTRAPRKLWGFAESVAYLHEPPPDASQAALDERTHPAWTRLKFDELLAQQLSLKIHRRARSRRRAPRLAGDGSLVRAFDARLPFTLTRAQQRVIAEIRHDLSRAEPMQRLLQG